MLCVFIVLSHKPKLAALPLGAPSPQKLKGLIVPGGWGGSHLVPADTTSHGTAGKTKRGQE